MYKGIEIICLAILVILAGQAKAQSKTPLQLSGTIKDVKEGTIYLQRYDNKLFKTIDSTEVINGAFAFTTAVPLPELYGLSLESAGTELQVFLDDQPTKIIVGKDQDLRTAEVSGSKWQSQFEGYKKRANKLTAAEFIQEDPTSIVAAFALFRNYSYDLSPQEIREHLALLDPSLSQTQYVAILKDLATKQEAVLPGNKAIDFVSTDPEGNQIRFFDHLGKGYVLLDFWAGWCPPCRAENPNIVKAYHKYKDKGFDVFGVSLDRNKSSWLKAIKDDQLDWTQVSDLAFWDTEAPALYGVRFIPSNLLIDSNGIIVARNVTGEELQTLLAELLD
ncbi:AhpC/TSA family protein [Sphingobacterium sp. lm-10]|uniref:TlpA disulfide reductase family protein n=1 Tax=Sphingobacterium sp. lm-10 TaxID=2944904 RepID=UPI002021EEA9|nr:TlpA disulfide reductase family protein [Sphingobacterium sp. lm-10]MCL7989278.1 AhpC/TSA family protein [Sphingobacterium sp. lm-10]